jgi:hypothetical protein
MESKEKMALVVSSTGALFIHFFAMPIEICYQRAQEGLDLHQITPVAITGCQYPCELHQFTLTSASRIPPRPGPDQ